MCKILQILLQVMLSLADSSLTPIILMKKDPFSDLNLKTSLGQLKWSGKKIYFPKMLKKQKNMGYVYVLTYSLVYLMPETYKRNRNTQLEN